MLRCTIRRGVALASTRCGAPSHRRFASSSSTSARETVDRLLKDASGEGGLDAVLNKLDSNGDGLIDAGELRDGLSAAGLNVTDKALAKLMSTYANGEGMKLKIADLHTLLDKVEQHRFFSFHQEAAEAAAAPAPATAAPVPQQHYVFHKSKTDHFEGAIEGMFARLDDNGDGVLQPAEIKKALQDLGVDVTDAKLDDIFTLYDANGDGVLQLAEFAHMVDTLQKDK